MYIAIICGLLQIVNVDKKLYLQTKGNIAQSIEKLSVTELFLIGWAMLPELV